MDLALSVATNFHYNNFVSYLVPAIPSSYELSVFWMNLDAAIMATVIAHWIRLRLLHPMLPFNWFDDFDQYLDLKKHDKNSK